MPKADKITAASKIVVTCYKLHCFQRVASRITSRTRLLVTAFVITLGLPSTAQTHRDTPAIPLARGIVVERTTKGMQADAAGIRPGDVLLSWKRGQAHGSLESPFDLSYVWVEEASRGRVTITGHRKGRHKIWVLGSPSWGISARPNFTGRLLTTYSDGKKLVQARKFADFVERFREAAKAEQRHEVSWLSPWLLSRAASTLAEAQQWDLFDDVLSEAIKYSEEAGSIVRNALFQQWAGAYATRDDLEDAYKRSNEALDEWRRLSINTVSEGSSLLSVAALDLQRGDFARAEEHLAQAKAIVEKLAPDGLQMVAVWGNLAVLHQDRGELEQAEEDYLNLLRKEEKRFPGSSLHVQTLSDLGVLYDQQGDLTRAEAYHRRALAMSIRFDPESLTVADILGRLAECVLEQGDPARAESYQRRALSIREKKAPGGLDAAFSLAGLGKIARIRGEPLEAERLYRHALSIATKVAAPNRDRAGFLIGLAAVLRDQGNFSRAETLYREALAIMDREDPGSIDRANTLAELAGTLYAQHKLDDSAELYRQAFSSLERKALQLGGREEDRSRYRAEHVRYYQRYMKLLLELGRPQEAFEELEGSRARTLLEMLSHSRVDVNQGVEPGLLESERRVRHQLNVKAENKLRLLNGAGTSKQIAVLDREIEELLLEHQRLQAQIKATNPGYAALIQPQALSAKQVQDLLDGDTILLEYSLGEHQSYVWAVTNQSLAAFALPEQHRIETLARHVYDLLTARNQAPKRAQDHLSWPEKEYLRSAGSLSQMLLGPVASMLGNKRLLIVSDGALQNIPFAALPTPEGKVGFEPLVLKHEIVNLPSASVIVELRRQRIGRPRPPRAVAVLADPVFDPKDDRVAVGSRAFARSSHTIEPGVTRAAEDLGLTRNGDLYLNRLLYTRNEANAILAAIPPGQGMAALDFSATRSLATNLSLGQYRIVHFATHGILDNKHPELSGLVLSLVNRKGKAQNGFLKLQDIYNLKLPVDLVVLSGCETGLGENVGGEGLIGLTRGFMYAGASRVVASLWSVSDMATADLMSYFYRAMERQDMRPAAALRAAQIEMWQQKQWRSPYYWAAFQIQGEWQ